MQINRPDSNECVEEVWREYTDKLESYCDYIEKCLKESHEFIDSLTSDNPSKDAIKRVDVNKYNNAVRALESICPRDVFGTMDETFKNYIDTLKELVELVKQNENFFGEK